MTGNAPLPFDSPGVDFPHSRHFDVQGQHLAVYTDQAGIAEAIHARLRLLATESTAEPDLSFEILTVPAPSAHWFTRPPGAARPVYNAPSGEVLYLEQTDQLYVSFDDRLRVLCDLGHGRTRVSVLHSASDNLWLVSHPLFTIPLVEHMKRRHRYSLHAASLCIDSRGLLLPGNTGSGKSTLAVALLRAGFGFMGDDMVYLAPGDEGLLAFGFPEDIDVTEQTAAFFPELQDMPSDSRLPGARKWQISTEELYGIDFVSHCRPVALVFPRISGRARSRLESLDEGQALLELVPNVLLTDPASSQQHLNALGELAKMCACYRLHTGTDLAEVPGLLHPLLNQTGPQNDRRR